MKQIKTALVLGATGGIGGETAAALLRHGWKVVAMTRDPERAAAASGERLRGIAWTHGDAMVAADVLRPAQGVDVIVHAVNPPAYRGWGELVLPMIDSTIAAAEATGARIVLPGTVYNYGADVPVDVAEDAPQHPATEKGRLRVELEQRLARAVDRGGRVLIVRFGDFFGPHSGNNWFSQGLVTPGRRLASITYPGRRGVGHSWTYLPDAAETIARLLDREDDLEPFARFHAEGVWDAAGTAMVDAIARAVGRPETCVKPLPWPLFAVLGLFNETLRGLYGMRHLWRVPLRLDNRKLVAFLGEEPQTPLSIAVADTLRAIEIN